MPTAAMTRQSIYDQLWIAQGGRCAICNKRQNTRKLAQDHDHVTGRVRGLLCMRCNRALGAYEYDVFVMLRAVDYIEQILRDRGLR